ncbi:MAG: efflux RND transporter periplasmic adaptor subunit [Bacteroidetes bacterium HGW-Bacteroidetes-3]|nr:MAG: efflux RND transporter periplasmic adaptor subunit [Bacteroidetes bacterium HGW-Bacteroidetes-3]
MTNMKKITLLFIASALIISCGKETEKTSLEELNTQKTVLVTKIDSLNAVLKSVEAEISKLDSDKNLQTVTILPVKNDIFKHFLEIQGVAKANKNIEISPELGGNVTAILVKEGQKVAAGQLLIQLDDSAIKNSINELNTQLSLAKTTFERQERLWNQKIGSEMQYLQAKAQKESLENNLATLKTQARKMRITAPFSGVVDEIFPRLGELTSPQMPIVRLLNIDNMYVEAEITETYLPIIKAGTETVVHFTSINKEIKSKISQVGNYINPANRSFKISINLENKDQSIKPNLLADIKIVDFETKGIIIPAALVQQDQNGKDYVFTVVSENNEQKVVKNLITAGNEYNHEIFVSAGLKETDTLVNAGARFVKEGDHVKISKN